MPKSKKKPIPSFQSEDQEREFWGDAESSDHVDWRKAERVRLSQLKPSTRTISVRFPESLLEELKVLANKRDVPYQSLLKLYVAEKVREELAGEVRKHSDA